MHHACLASGFMHPSLCSIIFMQTSRQTYCCYGVIIG